ARVVLTPASVGTNEPASGGGLGPAAEALPAAGLAAGPGNGKATAVPTPTVAGLPGLRFEAATGVLALHGGGPGTTIREALAAQGSLELTGGGQRHASDPASAFFDPALAGASRATLAGLDLRGAAELVLGNQALAGGLRVRADGPVTVQGDVSAAGALAV